MQPLTLCLILTIAVSLIFLLLVYLVIIRDKIKELFKSCFGKNEEKKEIEENMSQVAPDNSMMEGLEDVRKLGNKYYDGTIKGYDELQDILDKHSERIEVHLYELKEIFNYRLGRIEALFKGEISNGK